MTSRVVRLGAKAPYLVRKDVRESLGKERAEVPAVRRFDHYEIV